VARTVGQFAIRQGYRQFVGFATSRGAFPFKRAEPPAPTYAIYTPELSGPDGEGTEDGFDHGQLVQAQVVEAEVVQALPGGDVEAYGEAGTGLDAGELAIPSYDSLSASQVVQRLAGLSRDEVAAVAAYEAATRRRKTVLDRAEQLLR
jgi:hypothetical protein